VTRESEEVEGLEPESGNITTTGGLPLPPSAGADRAQQQGHTSTIGLARPNLDP
jgi:hypothetical protein